MSVAAWTGKQLSPEAKEAVLNITFHGYGLARDFARQGHPDSFWFAKAAQVVERLDPEDPLTLWTIGAYLNVFPVTRDVDGELEFGPPAEALRYGREGLVRSLDPAGDLHCLAVKRRAHERQYPGVAW